MNNSNKALHIRDDANKEEIEADAKRNEQERFSAASAAEEEEAQKTGRVRQTKPHGRRLQERQREGESSFTKDEQPVSDQLRELTMGSQKK